MTPGRKDARRTAEVHLVGNLLYAPHRLSQATTRVRPEDFQDADLRSCYERLLVVCQGIDDPEHRVEPEDVFPMHLIGLGLECYTVASPGTHVEFYARNVAMWSMIDKVASSGATLATTMAGSYPGAADSVLSTVKDHIAEVHSAMSHAVIDEGGRTMSESIDDMLDTLDKKHDGLATGIPSIDRALFPIQHGNMVVVASRAGVGKTTFALNMALSQAQKGRKVLFLSLEMSELEMIGRFVSRISGVDSALVRNRIMTDAQRVAFDEAARELRSLPIVLKELRDPTLAGIAVEVNANRPELVIVDYLQLVHQPDAESRVTEVGAVSRGLKRLARDARCVLVAVSQLSRNAEDKEPSLRDLRWAGEIEQDADSVIMLWKKDEQLKFDIAKHRHGPTRNGDLFMDLATYKIGSMETIL